MVIVINNSISPLLYWVNKTSTNIVFLICGVVYLLLPSVNTEFLMNGPQSGKTFVFLYTMMAIAVIILLKVFMGNVGYLKIALLDILLLIWLLYTLGNGPLPNPLPSLRLFELYGLVFLYIALRQFKVYYLTYLYITLIIGGGIQAIYGNLQLWGLYPSHHDVFKITGSFFNPGPYAGYLSGAFAVALGFYFFKDCLPVPENLLKKNKLNKMPLMKILLLILMACIILALAAAHSRAAFLALSISCGYLLFDRYRKRVNPWLKQVLNSPAKRIGITVIAILLASSLGASLYFIKKGSANGRLLIWKVSLNMIKDKPIFGHGFDQFKAHYMDYQAAFFEQNPDSEEAMVAGDTNYAFNEPLQQTVENGIVGLAFMVLILMTVFILGKKNNQILKYRIPNHLNPDRSVSRNTLCTIAKAGTISIFIFSFFSYPAQILPIKTSLILYLATIANFSPQTNYSFFRNLYQKTNRQLILSAKALLATIVLLLVIAGFKYLNVYVKTYHNWQNAYHTYQFGAYNACLKGYEKAYPTLKSNGDFLTHYGKALSVAGKPVKALNILKNAKELYPNTIVYTALGDSYKALGQYARAERAYLHAWHMNSSRFYPKYLLVKLFMESGQKEKAFNTANELLNKKVKVESDAIREIKGEMRKIIKR